MEAAYTRVGNLWSYEKYTPEYSVQEHFDKGYVALGQKDYDEALTQFLIVAYHFPETPFYADSLFFSGTSYFFLGHFDLADAQFAEYLNQTGNLKHFENVFEFKFQIAESYREGKKKHPFGVATLPRIASATEDALDLYDEIAAALPNRELAAKALYSKALLLRKQKQYKKSIEEFQILARRFPKHPLAADGFVQTGEVYLEQALREHQNPDYIALAKLNRQKFEKTFPSDERLASLDSCIVKMQ